MVPVVSPLVLHLVYHEHLCNFPTFLTVLILSPLLFLASQNTLHSPEASFLASLNPPSGHGSSSTPSFHLPSLPSQCYDASERTAPFMMIQRGQNGSAPLNPSQSKVQCDATGNSSAIFTHPTLSSTSGQNHWYCQCVQGAQGVQPPRAAGVAHFTRRGEQHAAFSCICCPETEKRSWGC